MTQDSATQGIVTESSVIDKELTPQALFATIVEKLTKDNPNVDLALVKKAFTIAMVAYGNVSRKSGEPFVMHPLRIVSTLIDLHFSDEATICAAFLHDVLEESTIPKAKLKEEFSEDIANIVDSLTVLDTKQVTLEDRKAQNLRKIILAMVKDIRVLVIKLVDRLDNMRTISVMSEESKKRNSEETLHVYAPLAEKIGLFGIKAELEDLAFTYVDPTLYAYIKSKVTASREEREQNTKEITKSAEKILAEAKIKASIRGRAKHFYSIYKKMVTDNKTISQIYDLYGLRIIVQTPEECYQVLHALEHEWHVLPNRFKDYIKDPKANGYQSLHQNFIIDEKSLEVQIRTKQMDDVAELGIATHWKYKNTGRDKRLERKISWIRQLLSWKQHTGASAQTQFSLFKDEIICITPMGDPIILSEGSTPIDFAYMIHSGIGDKMKVAKINGIPVPFDTRLSNGDIVSIETGKDRTVSQNWLAMAKHASTLQKIRHALGIDGEYITPNAKRAKSAKRVDIANAYQTLAQFQTLSKKTPIKVSQCCKPGIDDPVVAFYTKGKKLITVHQITCPNQYALDQRFKVILNAAIPKQQNSVNIDVLIDDTPGVFVRVLDTILDYHFAVQEVHNKDAANVVYLSIKINKKEGTPALVNEIKKITGVKDAKITV